MMQTLVVDWGDDSRETITESGSDLSKTHSYLNAGVYTLKIRGKAKRINFFNTKAQDKVTRIISKVYKALKASNQVLP